MEKNLQNEICCKEGPTCQSRFLLCHFFHQNNHQKSDHSVSRGIYMAFTLTSSMCQTFFSVAGIHSKEVVKFLRDKTLIQIPTVFRRCLGPMEQLGLILILFIF